jgi:UDP-N-acetyl-D-galactosamine dehydrogenase
MSVDARVGVLGLTFKENVPDLRNSRVVDVVEELASFGLTPLLHDPLAPASLVDAEYQLGPSDLEAFTDLDALILAVPHAVYREQSERIQNSVRQGGVLVDVKGMFEPAGVRQDILYWSL